MTARQNLEKLRLQKGLPDPKRIDEVLNLVGLENSGKKSVKDFSLGMKQRLGIAGAMLTKPDLTPSMSRRGNPYDNALAENFFSILKTECIYRTKIKTFADARRLIDDYIYFYNHQRIQLKTKLTPLELRSQFFA